VEHVGRIFSRRKQNSNREAGSRRRSTPQDNDRSNEKENNETKNRWWNSYLEQDRGSRGLFSLIGWIRGRGSDKNTIPSLANQAFCRRTTRGEHRPGNNAFPARSESEKGLRRNINCFQSFLKTPWHSTFPISTNQRGRKAAGEEAEPGHPAHCYPKEGE